jgi:hypothetical protein
MLPPLHSSRSPFSQHAVQRGCLCPFFVHPLCSMEAVTVVFVLHFSFFESDFEVINCLGIEKKGANNK